VRDKYFISRGNTDTLSICEILTFPIFLRWGLNKEDIVKAAALSDKLKSDPIRMTVTSKEQLDHVCDAGFILRIENIPLTVDAESLGKILGVVNLMISMPVPAYSDISKAKSIKSKGFAIIKGFESEKQLLQFIAKFDQTWPENWPTRRDGKRLHVTRIPSDATPQRDQSTDSSLTEDHQWIQASKIPESLKDIDFKIWLSHFVPQPIFYRRYTQSEFRLKFASKRDAEDFLLDIERSELPLSDGVQCCMPKLSVCSDNKDFESDRLAKKTKRLVLRRRIKKLSLLSLKRRVSERCHMIRLSQATTVSLFNSQHSIRGTAKTGKNSQRKRCHRKRI
jgi:hypothetical protein